MNTTTNQLRLPDGRALGYAEYGDPTGTPVLAFHGTLSSRLDIDFAADAAIRHNIRIISIDRPGMGLSDYQPRRHLTDWPADVHNLAEHLQIDTFAVYAWSAGAQYAFACAHTLRNRVTAIAAVGAPKPYNRRRDRKGIPTIDLAIMFAASHTKPILRTVITKTIIRADDDAIFDLVTDGAPPADIAYMNTIGRAKVAELAREAVRQGPNGAVTDFELLRAPWGFDLTTITTPVDLWHGTDDHSGPPDEQHVLANALPNATIHTLPGAGHVSAGPDHIDHIFHTLLTRTGHHR